MYGSEQKVGKLLLLPGGWEILVLNNRGMGMTDRCSRGDVGEELCKMRRLFFLFSHEQMKRFPKHATAEQSWKLMYVLS